MAYFLATGTLNPSRYRILAIGKLRKRWIQDGVELYCKRLPGLSITELREGSQIREGETILTALKSNETLVALSEDGETLHSEAFAERLSEFGSQRLAFLIGSAKGLSDEIKQTASWTLSLSSMTFPHDLARLLLVEQIYRAQTILNGGPYHRS